MKVYTKEQQHNAPLFGGRLYENRPISFPQGNHTNAYSNLFYWANVTAVEDGEFGLHPHQGFEIMTFIFKGALEHFDTQTQKWTPLKAGGVQVIQSGNGVQHAEKYVKGSQAFQIWFDPDFKLALQQAAAYKDYQSDAFDFVDEDGFRVKHYIGASGPIHYTSQGISVKAIELTENSPEKLVTDPDMVYSLYLLDGEIGLDGQTIKKDDYVILEDVSSIAVSSSEPSTLFIVATPKDPGYETQANRIKNP